MQVFNAKVRLAGSLLNEVKRLGLTVPEIVVLRRLHGEDAVVDIQHVGDAEVDDIDERGRLHEEYAGGLASLGEEQKTSIEKMFGGDYNPLPRKLRDYKGPLVKKMDFLENYMEPEPYEQVDVASKFGRKAMREKRINSAVAATTKKDGAKQAAVV